MRYILLSILTTFFLADCIGQEFADNFKNVNSKNFSRFTDKHKVEKFNLNNYSIVKATRTRKHKFICGSDPSPCENLQTFNEIIYLVNDTFVFFSFQDKDFTNFKADKLKNIFLFPDSSLGLIIYNEENVWRACIEANFYILNIHRDNFIDTIFQFKYSTVPNEWATINNKTMFGFDDTPYDKPYQKIKYIDSWDNGPDETKISFKWIDVGKKMKLNFNCITASGYDDRNSVIYNKTDLYYSFHKTKNKYQFTFDKSTSSKQVHHDKPK